MFLNIFDDFYPTGESMELRKCVTNTNAAGDSFSVYRQCNAVGEARTNSHEKLFYTLKSSQSRLGAQTCVLDLF